MISVVKGRLENFDGWSEGKDFVVWHGNSELGFSVASYYAFYERLCIPFGPHKKYKKVFGLVWKMEVSFKIKAFGWRLLHNKLPTKDLLVLRGISFSLDNLNCILGGSCSENRKHFFFGCWVLNKVWSEIAFWVGKEDSREEECWPNFIDWYLYFRSNKVKDRKLGVLWLATTWTLWLLRNGVCFRKDSWSVNNIVWNIKFLVWKWSFCGKITHPNYSFYEFWKEPLFFLL
ncbi:uncharacterized protein LOC131596917 [Vicia villosa]|uniref:uncharacterized protein LOC131596917 n=1 Tax=Vicia villosa TaxID=3911 RepID=UPI00273CAA5C|nr:uncharacterized protein LOC131596917 [Vicia villosa]